MIITLRNDVVIANNIVNEYLGVETHIGGGMHPKAAKLWGYFFAIQNANSIDGDLMEIGTFKGWGSYLPARYCRPSEKIVLVDIAQHHLDLSKSFLVEQAKVPTEVIETILIDSALGGGLSGALNASRRFRWIHIDGEHSYAAVIMDLDAAAKYAATDAIICVDDVDHPLAPCINDALLDWLSRNKSWKLLLRGYNKAYLISVRTRVPWLSYIDFLPEIFSRFFSSSILLASQTQSSDTQYFSYGERFDSNAYLKVNKTVSDIDAFDGISPRCFLLGEACKPSILVFGNCQMNILHGALVAATHLCGMDVRFDYVKDIHLVEIEDANKLRQLAGHASGIICQKIIGDKFLLRTTELLDCLVDPWSITVPSMHFNAYWPNHADLQMCAGSLHCMPIDAIIYSAVISGCTDQEIIDLLISPTLYSASVIKDWFLQAVGRLRQREELDNLDIRISDFLENTASTERLFYIFNHPKKKVFDFVLRKVLHELSNTFQPKNFSVYKEIVSGSIEVQYDMSLIDFIDIPPLRSINHNFDLPFTETNQSVYRYNRSRGSREIHRALSIEDEIFFVREHIKELSDSQLSFNLDAIANSTCLPPMNL